MSVAESLPYQSPLSKLLRFFRRSRDKWKAKCKAAKQENKSLKYRLAKMTENRDHWKNAARNSAKRSPPETRPVEEEPPKNRGQRPSRGRRCRPAKLAVVAAQ